eukprot:scaffold340_cov96-Cylindrotheca_fusiformis.AAC.1
MEVVALLLLVCPIVQYHSQKQCGFYREELSGSRTWSESALFAQWDPQESALSAHLHARTEVVVDDVPTWFDV